MKGSGEIARHGGKLLSDPGSLLPVTGPGDMLWTWLFIGFIAICIGTIISILLASYRARRTQDKVERINLWELPPTRGPLSAGHYLAMHNEGNSETKK